MTKYVICEPHALAEELVNAPFWMHCTREQLRRFGEANRQPERYDLETLVAVAYMMSCAEDPADVKELLAALHSEYLCWDELHEDGRRGCGLLEED